MNVLGGRDARLRRGARVMATVYDAPSINDIDTPVVFAISTRKRVGSLKYHNDDRIVRDETRDRRRPGARLKHDDCRREVSPNSRVTA